MFERFTDRARRVVVLAQEEARLLNHNYIGTEHILLGLIHEGEGVAAKALESLGISLEAVRSQVEEIIGQGGSSPSGHIPFTPRAKKVLELSLREALQLGPQLHRHRAHVARTRARGRRRVAAQVLVRPRSADHDACSQPTGHLRCSRATAVRQGRAERARSGATILAHRASGESLGRMVGRLVLDQFGRNLTQSRSRDGKLDPLVGTRQRGRARYADSFSSHQEQPRCSLVSPVLVRPPSSKGLAQKIDGREQGARHPDRQAALHPGPWGVGGWFSLPR